MNSALLPIDNPAGLSAGEQVFVVCFGTASRVPVDSVFVVTERSGRLFLGFHDLSELTGGEASPVPDVDRMPREARSVAPDGTGTSRWIAGRLAEARMRADSRGECLACQTPYPCPSRRDLESLAALSLLDRPAA